ncbi:MAG: DUF4143 domain-containing protein [Deltaproteobacteria bacterium]|nr:DUF4143 domain-containing protein [Deltaproteobacteria bacterium]
MADLSRDLGIAVNTARARLSVLVETHQVAVLRPYLANLEPQVYFRRTMAGSEVDIVVETGGKLVPIEVKLSATPRPAMAAALKAFQKDMGDKALPGYVEHPGEISFPLGQCVTALKIFSFLK